MEHLDRPNQNQDGQQMDEWFVQRNFFGIHITPVKISDMVNGLPDNSSQVDCVVVSQIKNLSHIPPVMRILCHANWLLPPSIPIWRWLKPKFLCDYYKENDINGQDASDNLNTLNNRNTLDNLNTPNFICRVEAYRVEAVPG